MTFCTQCGAHTDPEWVHCRACGRDIDRRQTEPRTTFCTSCSATITSSWFHCPECGTATELELSRRRQAPTLVGTEIEPGAVPRVELISRRWDVVDVTASEEPREPHLLPEPDLRPPVPAGGVEITVDEISVTAGAKDPADHLQLDSWHHLRPAITHSAHPMAMGSTGARYAEVTTLLLGVAALVVAGVFLLWNVQLDEIGRGAPSVGSTWFGSAGALLTVILPLFAANAAIAIAWWARRLDGPIRLGPAGVTAVAAATGGVLLSIAALSRRPATVAAQIEANGLAIVGLGLIMLACLAAVRAIGRVDWEQRR